MVKVSSDPGLHTPVTLRKSLGLTQTQLAQRLGIRQKTVSDWERGVSVPNLPLSKVKLMMQVFNLTLDELIEVFERERSVDRN